MQLFNPAAVKPVLGSCLGVKMDNITKMVAGVLSVAGFLAFLTPSSPSAGIDKNLAVKSSGKPTPVGNSANDDESPTEDTEIVDEDGQPIDDSEVDDDSSDDFDVKDFGKPSIGSDDDDISSNSLPPEVEAEQRDDDLEDEQTPVAASPGSAPPARWEGRPAPAF